MAKKAVLCGINNYQSQTDLRGCVNDVENMHRLLTEVFEFDDSQIHRLFNEEVIKVNIQREWQWLIQDAQPGDHLLFHFSGHGSYVPDDQSDELDGFDEITCLYDMDFEQSHTYLRDDEWNSMLQQVPAGVLMTVVMDNCHSGTGTRAITVNVHGQQQSLIVDQQTSARSLTSETELYEGEDYKKLIGDHEIVLSRFLEPPISMQVRQRRIERLSRSSDSQSEPENYLLITACRADQTAADAYISDDFHGAFTYYLCETLRRSSELTSEQLIETVKQELRSNRYVQEPQHEGPIRGTGLFSKTVEDEIPSIFNGDLIPNPDSEPASPINLPTESPMQAHSIDPETQRLLIEAYMKLLDTIGASAVSASMQAGISTGMPTGMLTGMPTEEEKRQTATANRHLVYVHGISQHKNTYSDPWWNSLQPYVGQTYGAGTLNSTRWEVLWSDLVNASRALEGTRSTAESLERERLRREINLVMQERQQQEIATRTKGGPAARQAANQARSMERGSGFSIDDFLTYMLDSKMRQQIIDRFTKVVEPLLRTNNRIDIISHSWGTVVAYEGLRELERNPSIQGRIGTFFTVGSALSMFPVRSYLRQENKDGRRPAFVDRWMNLDAKGDLVGGMLGDMFDVNQDYLELVPTSCPRGLFGYGLACAHSSYFVKDNVTVNRDIFGKFITS